MSLMNYIIEFGDELSHIEEEKMTKDLVAYESTHEIDVNYKKFLLVLKDDNGFVFGVLKAFTAFAEIYGNGFTSPLLLKHSQPQQQGNRIFRCLHVNGEHIVQELNEGRWKSWYAFKMNFKRIADFEERNRFHQTCEESVFFGKRICMIAYGDKTMELVGNVLTKKTASKKIIRIVPEEEIPHLVKIEFGIDLLGV